MDTMQKEMQLMNNQKASVEDFEEVYKYYYDYHIPCMFFRVEAKPQIVATLYP